MNNVKLSKRLRTIASLVDCDRVCDVGCDHGKLAYYLLKQNIVKFAYVSDISKPSLSKADKLLTSANLNFKSIYCDGLMGYNGINVNCAIIAGMGGDEIMHIIETSPIDIDTYILSPQHNILPVKEFMIKRGYNIIYDKILKDGHKYYDIFKCVKGKIDDIDQLSLYFGKGYNINELNDLRDFLINEKIKVSNIFDGVSESKKEQLRHYLDLIDKMQKEYNL